MRANEQAQLNQAATAAYEPGVPRRQVLEMRREARGTLGRRAWGQEDVIRTPRQNLSHWPVVRPGKMTGTK